MLVSFSRRYTGIICLFHLPAGISGNRVELAYGTQHGTVSIIIQHPETVGQGPQLFQTFSVHTCPVAKVHLSDKHLLSGVYHESQTGFYMIMCNLFFWGGGVDFVDLMMSSAIGLQYMCEHIAYTLSSPNIYPKPLVQKKIALYNISSITLVV